MEYCLWNHGCGILAVESWLWNPGCGILAVESWPLNPDCGILTVESGLWHPDCRIVALKYLEVSGGIRRHLEAAGSCPLAGLSGLPALLGWLG